ncbi:Sm-like ribonucleoprotein [Russula earlei]|uniref:Sm-like ribonucleoprotein n=1 Tax=Russula earlei TaxID=71964 RepID=A0ACC0UIT6_9AGAM|nr:Sm-like ribonucleoprotein [Russula earlei]
MPPPKSKGGKMLGLINWRLKVTINDGRAFIGQMLAFDRHMNLVLADCEEFRRIRPKKKPGETEAGPEQEMKRSLGLVILRGETVVSLSVEGPPPVQDDDKKSALPPGPGRGMPAGRGMGMMPPTGPPAFARPPVPFAPPGMPGAPPGFRPGFPPGVPFPPPPGFGGPPSGFQPPPQ